MVGFENRGRVLPLPPPRFVTLPPPSAPADPRPPEAPGALVMLLLVLAAVVLERRLPCDTGRREEEAPLPLPFAAAVAKSGRRSSSPSPPRLLERDDAPRLRPRDGVEKLRLLALRVKQHKTAAVVYSHREGANPHTRHVDNKLHWRGTRTCATMYKTKENDGLFRCLRRK